MRIYLLVVIGIVLGWGSCLAATPAELLTGRLRSLQQQGIMFGQQDFPFYGTTWEYDQDRSDCKDVCGDSPAVLGCELGGLELDRSKNLDGVPFDRMRQEIIKHHQGGGIVTISWHAYNPLNGGDAWNHDGNAVETVLPGGKNHAMFQERISRIADFIKSLKADGKPIPVIFRPWHEMSGGWFWWGEGNCTHEQYKALFHMTVEAFRKAGLTNVVWNYSPGAGECPTKDAYMTWYPGDDCVDMLGIDAYQSTQPGSTPAFVEQLQNVCRIMAEVGREHGKLYALTEFGYQQVPQADWWTNGLWQAVKDSGLSYMLTWRNTYQKPKDAFVPDPTGVSAADFRKFRDMSKVLFLSDIKPKAKAAYSCSSPDGKLCIGVSDKGWLSWSVSLEGSVVLEPSRLSMTVDGVQLGQNPKVKRAVTAEHRGSFKTPFYKKSEVNDDYNQLTLQMRGYSVEFRVYDDGVAYRFVLDKKGEVTVNDEFAEFCFGSDWQAYVPYVNDNRGGDRYGFSFESYYDEQRLSQMFPDSLAITPLLVCQDGGRKVAVMEGGLEDYAGMFLEKSAGNSLRGVFAHYPLETEWGGYMMMNAIPTRRADYIAMTTGRRSFPWRAIVVTTDDRQLANNDMAQRLAPACRLKDTSWIRPGKVAWDWWNTLNLMGVSFETGMNTPTYKYFIDFAARNHLEYIIIDCGWSSGSSTEWKGETLMQCSPDIDLDELIAYGKERGVGIILWASWALTQKECDEVFPYYAAKGIKGFKVDFLDADNQAMTASMWTLARKAADHHLLMDFHGMKATGLQRAYPNVVNFEGVKGLENCKWNPNDEAKKTQMLRYDVSIPFIRTLCGPMDYTPGAMTNASFGDFFSRNDHPMSLGTRARQVAMYTIFEAPLQMLADSPTAYKRNQDCTDMIAQVPTTFDETRILDAEVGEYIVTARRKGATWYIGAMTNREGRDLNLTLDFLTKPATARIIADGRNADKEGQDYTITTTQLQPGQQLSIHLAPAGGWAAIIK